MEPFDDERYPIKAPGWAALDHALASLYPGQTPHQFASKTGYDLDSANPLPAVSVCEGKACWHYVTYGLTELFEKSSKQKDVSGFGYELCFRLPREPADVGAAQPPTWPLSMLQGIGKFVLSGHGPLDSGHIIDLGGALDPDGKSALTGVVLVPDPELGKIETPHGSVLFLTLFGLAPDELEAMESWDLPRKVGLVNEVAALVVTDPQRASLREDRRTAAIFRRYALGVLI